ncbi:MAG: hypothetical protein ACTS8Z_08800, partial [Candidatus Limnocylindrales bacterium]
SRMLTRSDPSPAGDGLGATEADALADGEASADALAEDAGATVGAIDDGAGPPQPLTTSDTSATPRTVHPRRTRTHHLISIAA